MFGKSDNNVISADYSISAVKKIAGCKLPGKNPANNNNTRLCGKELSYGTDTKSRKEKSNGNRNYSLERLLD